MKLGIFTAFRNLHKNYIKACEHLNIPYEVIDIISDDWLEKIQASDCDGFLCRPPSKFEERNRMFDEKLHFIANILKKPIYPSYNELLMYENKRYTSYWLKTNNLPHPETHVFYQKEEFLDFLEKTNYPFVLKNNTGSTAKGVKFVKSKSKGKRIAKLAFGLRNSKLAIGYTPQTTGKIIPVPALGTLQRHHVLTQEFLNIKWEWRMIKIGNSYFGHKKLLNGEFASGSGKVGWDKPPEELLRMTKKICELGGFHTINADIFETESGDYKINELQAIFGSFADSQMNIDGKPCRFLYDEKTDQFNLEEGVFNQFGSSLLRVEHFLDILASNSER